MIKTFLVCILFFNLLFGCEVCKLDIPTVSASLKIDANKSNTTFDVKWLFDKEFVSGLIQYDLDKDGKFNKSEQIMIQDSLDQYLPTVNYNLKMVYLKKNEKLKKNKIEQINNAVTTLVFLEDGTMVYSFQFSQEFILKENHRLFIDIYDKFGNFNYHLKDVTLSNYSRTQIIKPESTRINIYLYDYYKEKEKIQEEKDQSISLKKDEKIETQDDFLEYLSENLEIIKQKLKELLVDIQEKDSYLSYILLLGFSFIYGVLHAVGPGHGKSLVSAYFLSENQSYVKAASVSLAIGLVHTFSAFIITVVIFFVLTTMFSGIINDIEAVAIKVSAIVIILIGIYLLVKKVISLKQKEKTQNIKWSEHQHSHSTSCGCGSCNTQSTDIGVVLAAGIVPCPGTVTIFLFTISLGIYFVGFLSAVFMSLGMSLVIFAAAVLSVKIRKSSSANQTLVKFLEFGSLVFIIILGVLLFIS